MSVSELKPSLLSSRPAAVSFTKSDLSWRSSAAGLLGDDATQPASVGSSMSKRTMSSRSSPSRSVSRRDQTNAAR